MPRLYTASGADALPDDGDHRQIHCLPGDAAERAEVVGHTVGCNLHDAEQGDDAQHHDPSKLEYAVFQTVRQTDAEDLAQHPSVEDEFFTKRNVNGIPPVGQQQNQQQHRRKTQRESCPMPPPRDPCPFRR